MKDKTCQELIEEAERIMWEPREQECFVYEGLIEELASRLKSANALLDERLTQVSALHIELKATSGRLDAANDVKAAQKIVLEHLEKELKAANEKLAECESGVIDMTIEEARIRAREKIDYDNCD